jgi:ABC-type transporter Mla maintaining outer membrane lipid asymmetry permease subunit MlaE
MGDSWLGVPREWIASFGEIARFAARVIRDVVDGSAARFFGEALRQAGILILGSALVIWGLAFILGLQCGIVGAGFGASYLAVVQQIGEVSSGGFFLIFWMFQNPPDLLYSLIKGMAMATVIVLVGCYYGYTASGGPVGVGTATAKSMVLNIVLVHLVGMVGTQIFWGSNPRAPIGG